MESDEQQFEGELSNGYQQQEEEDDESLPSIILMAHTGSQPTVWIWGMLLHFKSLDFNIPAVCLRQLQSDCIPKPSGGCISRVDSPFLQLNLKSGRLACAQFPDNPGDDMVKNGRDYILENQLS